MYISKMVEKAALNQFNAHSDNHDLLPDFQLAYREGYSTETALLKLVNDALWSMENKRILVVAIMDLSTAFDMVDHDLLLSVLHNSFGISDTALSWYETYLRPHTMTVKVNNSSSEMTNLKYGVPQGSCSGANIFTAYSSLIKNAVDDTFTLNGFADDHSIQRDYVAGNINEMNNLKKDLEKNLDSIGHWMDQMRLKLNPNKTELISFGGRAQLKKGIITSIEVGDATVNASTNVKYLGAHLDQTLDFKKQVMMKTRTARFNLSKIRNIWKFLTKEAAETVMLGLVMSHLDYSNSLYNGLPAITIDKLQITQNLAAKVILNLPRFASATTAMFKLHWLPIRQRIKYKLATIVFKCLSTNYKAPNYLTDLLIQLPKLKRNLRSSMNSSNKLVIPFVKKKTFAERSFSVTAP